MDYVTSNRMDHDFIIDGRSTYEETHWWNPELREENKRPGPGVLPPVLAEELHNSNHSLFSVNVTIPSTPSFSNLQYSVDYPPPAEEEVRTSIPHQNAYYCPKDNGWVILSWNSSSVAPPLARSCIASALPDQVRRRRAASCIEKGDQPFGKINETHHFHKYEKAVDSHTLTPPYRKEEWESLETVKGKRPVVTILTTDSNTSAIKADDVETLSNIVESAEEEGELLDLYVCCQCSFYCVASGVIPGVIPPRHLEELVRHKKAHPAVGESAERSIALAVHTVLM
jgi:ubiquitin carboxyl-terminal hydrolase 25/28